MSVTRTVFIDTALSNYASLAAQYDPNTFNVVLLNNASSSASQIQNWMQSNNAIAANINIVSSVGGLNGSVTPRIAFVDPSVANFQTVIASMPGNITVVVLDLGKDGIQQIHDYLAANASNVASVDIISHGSPGEVVLGTTVLNAATLGSYSNQLADIGSHLTADGDLLLYGCDVASGATGQQFITALAAATGADVAASTDLTGSAAAGGNWTLEASTGPIETAALNIANYNGLLDAATAINSVTLSSDTGVSSSDFITKTAAQTITGTFSASTNGNSAPTIWVSTDGTGASRTQATVTYTDNAGNGSYSASVTLIAGTGKSIQFWSGANGNNPIAGSKTYTLDMTAPTTTVSSLAFSNDTGASTSDFITNSTAQTVSGVLSANTVQGEVVRVSIDNGATWQTASNVVGQKTFSLSGVTLQGNNTLKVQVEDAAGNAGQAISQSYVLDTRLTAPTVALTADSGKAGDGLTNNAALTFNTADSDATRVITVDSKIVTSYDPTTLADGSHTVSVADTDVAGNTKSASVSFTLDTKLTAPTVALTTDSGKPGDGLTNNAALTFNTADSDATRAITIDGQVVNSYDPSSLADGSHTVSVTDTDGAGNTKSASVSFLLDTKLTAPTVALTTDSGKAGDGLTNNAGLTFNAPDSDATRVITVDGKVVNSYDASSMADGSHTVSVTDTDSAGNTKNASLSFTLDTKLTAPTVALTTDSGKPGDGLTNNAGLTFNTADGDATRVITVDGKVVSSYDASALADGSHTVSVTDTDGAGNNGTASVSFTLDTKLTAPTVALTSDSGKPGDGLTNNAGLTFNTADSDATRVITVDGKVVSSYDASALADGGHTVSVTDTDGAGNTGTASVSFILDTKLTAPTVALTSDSGKPGDGLTNNAGLTFNTADSDATRVIAVDGKVVNSYDASALADGSHTVSVTDTDGAGNTGTASVSFTLDTKLTAPTVALTTDSGKPGDGLTNNAGLTFNTADSDATRVITVDGKVVNSYDASALADGSHTVSVTDTDGAGNTGTAAVSFILDTKLTAPTVSLTTDSGKPGDGLTNNAGLTFNTADSDATRVITVDGKVVSSYDASALADGGHTVSVTDTDGAGNTGTASVSFTLDTKLTAPTVSLTTDSGKPGDGLTNNAGLTFNTADSDATRVITVDGKVVNSYDASALADGSHTVSVTDTDGAGNTGTASVSFTLDTKLTAPTVSLTTDSGKPGDGLTNNAGLTFNAADSDATRVITVDGKVVNSYDASALADGSHTVSVTDTDGAGNTGTASVSFTLDTKLTAPTVSLTTDSGKPGDGLTNNAGLTFNAADSDATRVITVDGKVVNSYDASALADGSHTVSVTDTDGAGNTGTASVSFTLDTKLTAPTVALTTDSGKPGDGLTNNAGLTFNTADTDATRVITVDGKVVNSYDASALADGSHTVSVTDTDGAGNTGTASVSFTLDTKLTAPTVSLTTDSGKPGDGLTNNAGLTFNAADSDATRVITVDG
ncbi:Ig-like domain-containing protein, partial [Massilia terrae]